MPPIVPQACLTGDALTLARLCVGKLKQATTNMHWEFAASCSIALQEAPLHSRVAFCCVCELPEVVLSIKTRAVRRATYAPVVGDALTLARFRVGKLHQS